jgi:hypothetical protein
MKRDTARDEFVALMNTPFGVVPDVYWPFLHGSPELADVGSAIFGPEFSPRLLVNTEAVHLMTAEVEDFTPGEAVRVLRESVLRVLSQLTSEPARCMVLVEEAKAWFGRPVLVHQRLDGKNPFIAIAA